jgi:IS5 family transposase
MSEYRKLYDIVIPGNHLLRKIEENINFEFVNKLLEKSYCKEFGRPAKEPEMMFKLMFLKRMYDLSDREVISRSETDLAYKYFLRLNPEDKLPDPSLLTVFRKSRLNDEEILEEMLTEIVKQAVEKGLIKGNAIIVDSTHSKSKGINETPNQMLRRISKELRKEIYCKRPELAEKFPEKPADEDSLDDEIKYIEELIDVLKKDITDEDHKKLKNRYNQVKELVTKINHEDIQSITDENAKVGYKSESDKFFGYKNHLAVTEERIITGVEVTDGAASDGKQLGILVEKTKQCDIDVKEVIGDKAYSGKDNLEYSDNIKIISKLHPVISNGNRKNDDGFYFNKDADMMVCKAGHLAIKKYKMKENADSKNNRRIIYHFDTDKCKECPKRKGCYKDGARRKTYSITILSDTHEKQKEFQETEYFKERAKQRYIVEAKNAELKQSHGLDKCNYLGLIGMKIQSYFTVITSNVKRIIKLTDTKTASIVSFLY